MEKEETKKKNIIKEYLPYVLIIILVILIKRYIVSPVKVSGTSMMDTLHSGDIMILNSSAYYFDDIKRFDIVVIDEGKEYIIKRVIGLPGETVEYRDNKLYINDKELKDSYGNGLTNDFKAKVGKNSYFVLGDNRANSMDSRIFGDFKKNKIIGKTNLTVFPFKRFGTKK